MFENKDGARKINEILTQISALIEQGRDAMIGPEFGEDERKLFNSKMSKILGNEILELFSEIWRQHPDLIPPGAQPWPTEYKRRRGNSRK